MIDAAKKTADGIGETVIIDHTEEGFKIMLSFRGDSFEIEGILKPYERLIQSS